MRPFGVEVEGEVVLSVTISDAIVFEEESFIELVDNAVAGEVGQEAVKAEDERALLCAFASDRQRTAQHFNGITLVVEIDADREHRTGELTERAVIVEVIGTGDRAATSTFPILSRPNLR